jgi:hypothetical protein
MMNLRHFNLFLLILLPQVLFANCTSEIQHSFAKKRHYTKILAVEISNQGNHSCMLDRTIPYWANSTLMTQYELQPQQHKCFLFFGSHAETSILATCKNKKVYLHQKINTSKSIKTSMPIIQYKYGANQEVIINNNPTISQLNLAPKKSNNLFTQYVVQWKIKPT